MCNARRASSQRERICDSALREVVLTDTIFMRPDTRARWCKMGILSVAPLLAEVLLRIHEGRSVGDLFST
jgi:ribose-phosphate pyrophosphokinase